MFQPKEEELSQEIFQPQRVLHLAKEENMKLKSAILKLQLPKLQRELMILNIGMIF
jgi:hypothetical protein|tara:strand:- start:193 stop:360 length:168 start_codon:yes stop_codon:yes gene_type:complete